jgi:hypothetical protein
VSGCGHEAIKLIPMVVWTAATFPELIAAHLHHYYHLHEPQLSDRYASAVEGTVVKDSTEGRRPDLQAI